MSWAKSGDETGGGYPYTCGYCHKEVVAKLNYRRQSGTKVRPYDRIAVCPGCDRPTYFGGNGYEQVPGPRLGAEVEHLTADVEGLYGEARNCVAISAYTAAALMFRKLLMNVAVAKGARAGLSFVQYVDYLESEGYTSPKHKDWVDRIRDRGNDATHETTAIPKADAVDLLHFSEMLLKMVYDFPGRVAARP